MAIFLEIVDLPSCKMVDLLSDHPMRPRFVSGSHVSKWYFFLVSFWDVKPMS